MLEGQGLHDGKGRGGVTMVQEGGASTARERLGGGMVLCGH